MKIEKKVTLHLDSEEVEKLKKILLVTTVSFNSYIKSNIFPSILADVAQCYKNDFDHLRDFADRLNEEL